MVVECSHSEQRSPTLICWPLPSGTYAKEGFGSRNQGARRVDRSRTRSGKEATVAHRPLVTPARRADAEFSIFSMRYLTPTRSSV